MVVPLEYREAGCPPASWFIQPLMDFLDRPYYVGLLSAAAIHGAAHQQPMVFQVITDMVIKAARAGRVAIQFHQTREHLTIGGAGCPNGDRFDAGFHT